MFDQTFQGLPRQIQAVEIGIAVLQFRHQPQGMCVVVEAAERPGGCVQRLFSRMAERRVAQVVGQ